MTKTARPGFEGIFGDKIPARLDFQGLGSRLGALNFIPYLLRELSNTLQPSEVIQRARIHLVAREDPEFSIYE